jgi:hypothetical protein
MATVIISAQQPKSLPSGVSLADAAKLCAHFSGEWADGWPGGPLYILFHREKSTASWHRNPAIQVPGLESASPASAHTLVCVEEELEEKGKYESGETGYVPHWNINLVRLADGRVYYPQEPEFIGEDPPEMKLGPGAGIGKPPLQPFVRWLHLLVDQNVARFRMRFSEPSENSHGELVLYDGVSGMAVSRDGKKLVVAWEARGETGISWQGLPPSPVTVFDLATTKAIASFHLDYSAGRVAISNSGNLIATQHYDHAVEIWDAASGQVVHKLDAPAADSLLFGPDDSLATAGEGQVAVWDVGSERKIHSAAGSRIMLSPAGVWLIVRKDSSGISVQEMESGRSLSAFPKFNPRDQYVFSEDGAVVALDEFGVWAGMFTAGGSQRQDLAVPSLGMDVKPNARIQAIGPTRDGIVFAGSQIAGIASSSNPEQRFFAIGDSHVKTIALSPDGKLVILADASGNGSVWELH